jgi:hypothetical protein
MIINTSSDVMWLWVNLKRLYLEQFLRWKIIFIQQHCLWQRFYSQQSIRHNSGGMGFDEKSVFHVSSLINSPLILVYLIFYVRVLSLTQLTNLLSARLLQIACQEIFLDIWEILLPSPTCMAWICYNALPLVWVIWILLAMLVYFVL